MSEHPDHELEVLEDDQTIPPRPEEVIADAGAPPGLEQVPAPPEGELPATA
jgi:hypothetical protein